MAEKRQFLRIARKLCATFVALFAFAIAPAYAALPSGYTELEYLESNGNQYIDTGKNFASNIKTYMETMYYSRGGYGWGRNDSKQEIIWADKVFYFGGGYSETARRAANVKYAYDLDFTAGAMVAKINGNVVRETTNTYDATVGNKIYLFAYNERGISIPMYSGRVYGFKYTNGSTVEQNLIPAKRNSDGEIGMYDTVSNTFFTNAGTGTFTAGPAKCRNLFDKTTVTANKYITPSGSITSDGTNRTVVSGEIYVKPSTTYTLSGVGNIYDASYNRSGFQYQADGTPISAITATQNTGIVTFTTDANCAYVRVMSVTANVDTAMLEEGSTATDYVPFCATPIKIATTAYNAARFSPVQTDLDNAVATIRDIVTKTINQTAAIASLQADKQTRPAEQCPAGKKCLLVETEENGVVVPHWYPIIESADD